MMALAKKQLADIEANKIPMGGPSNNKKKPKHPAWLN